MLNWGVNGVSVGIHKNWGGPEHTEQTDAKNKMLLTSAKTFIEVNVLNEEFKSNIHLNAFHNI